MGSVLIILALLFAASAIADDHVFPPVCPDAERHDVCEIKIQRNDALDEIAIEKQKLASMQQAEDKLAGWWSYYANGAARTAEWWEKYVAGVGDVVEYWKSYTAGDDLAARIAWWQSYARGMDQQVAMWKELCARHHCSQSGY
jgi:hypothetical protein